MNKKMLLSIIGGLVVLVLGGAAIFTALQLQEAGTESVAPNAPQSQPRAQTSDNLPSNPVELTFTITGTPATTTPATTTPATTTPATTTPATTTPATTTPATGGTGSLASAGTTKPATPKATAKPATGSAQTLPEAGMTMPTILGIAGGALLLFAGLILAL